MPTEPITADNVYINGDAYRATDAAWLGIGFNEAELVSDGRVTISNVLRVPWVHPEDRARGVADWARYRVRSRNPRARFTKVDNRWHVEVE